jgi:hypothetical protein
MDTVFEGDNMGHQPKARMLAPGSLGMAGGALVLVGTYWVPWFSLTGVSGPRFDNFGGFNLYQLRTFVTSGWYTHASQVMTVGAAFLVISGIAALIASRNRMRWSWACSIGTSVGSGITLFAAFTTGLPHWSTAEPLFYSQGAGEWICVAGAIIGIASCVIMIMFAGSGVMEPQVKPNSQLPTMRVS